MQMSDNKLKVLTALHLLHILRANDNKIIMIPPNMQFRPLIISCKDSLLRI